MSLVPWSPLANGFLTGKYPPTVDTAAAEQRTGGGRLAAAAGYPDQPTHTDRDWAVLSAVRDAATTLGCSPAQIALAWTMHQPAVATTLIGATSTEQLTPTWTPQHSPCLQTSCTLSTAPASSA